VIRIIKPSHPPLLRRRGPRATRALCAAFDDAPQDYLSGVRTFAFDATLYGADSVKKALRKAQHDKCAFCESKFTHTGYGDVEHLRPKGGFKQRPEDALGRPGYYWLAYDWDNLFCSCQLCNQRFKRNLFPLRDPARRARSHRDDLGKESPLLLDPADDPSSHLGFRNEIAFPVGGSPQGQTTIDALGLNRPELVEVRLDRLRIFAMLLETRTLLAKRALPGSRERSLLKKLDAEVDTHTRDVGEFAAMLRAALVGPLP
jgi:uncharacterized protein (TIGR02646 family)